MKTLFISDLHLSPSEPKIADLFFRFLQTEVKTADALYILGDLFEVWVGDDNLTPFNQCVIDALRKLTDDGVPIYLMHGNRDFLIRKRFLKASGCQLIKDPTVIELYGHRVLLSHGDIFCTKDVKYQRNKKLFRRPFLMWLGLLVLPLSLRKHKAEQMREKSKQRAKTLKQTGEYSVMADVVQETVEAEMKKHQTHYLIHGHTHRSAIHHFEIHGEAYTRAVLGDWLSDTGNMLVCRPDESTDKPILESKPLY